MRRKIYIPTLHYGRFGRQSQLAGTKTGATFPSECPLWPEAELLPAVASAGLEPWIARRGHSRSEVSSQRQHIASGLWASNPNRSSVRHILTSIFSPNRGAISDFVKSIITSQPIRPSCGRPKHPRYDPLPHS